MHAVLNRSCICTFYVILALLPLNGFAAKIEKLTKTCVACHGAKGVSKIDTSPNIAGQQRNYLATQMRAFRDGSRGEATMAAAVKNLSDADINKLADYYSSLPWAKSKTQQSVDKNGKNYRAKCISCHGMKGMSVTSDWPHLAGQKQQYLEKTLLDIQSGARPSAVMEVIVKELNEKQIKALSLYYSQL